VERIEGRGLTWVGGYSAALPRELQRGPIPETQLWWLDAGNGENYGQVLIGNSERAALDAEKGVWHTLPLPTIQRPDLLREVPRQQDCAGAVLTGEQGSTINQTMASLVLEVVRKLIEGTCSWMQLYLDLDKGILSPVLVSPEIVERMTGIKREKLVRKEGNR
jgi:hypothetical protein